MFDQNDTAGLSAGLLALQNRCALGLGASGTNCDVFAQIAYSTPGQAPQVITAGSAVNSLAARTSANAFVTEGFTYDSQDKLLAALGFVTEMAFDLLGDPNASITGTVQVTPIFWGGQRGNASNHSIQVAMANGQVFQKHIETTA